MTDIHLDHPRAADLEERLRGRTVRDAEGNRLGVVRAIHATDDDHVTGLVVRDRWFFGPTHTVPADGMQVVHGDIVLGAGSDIGEVVEDPRADSYLVAAPDVERDPRDEVDGASTRSTVTTSDDDIPEGWTREQPDRRLSDRRTQVYIRPLDDVDPADRRAAVPATPANATVPSVEPRLLPSDAARMRYGGLDGFASLTGTLVAFALTAIFGTLLAAIADTTGFALSTGANTIGNLGSTAVAVGFGALFLAYLVGGWSTGRMARFDGAANGLLLTVWTIVLAAVFGGLGALFGGKYDVLANTNLPRVDFTSFDASGVAAVAIGLVVLLVAGALGGAIGEAWHRRADATAWDTEREREVRG